MSIQSSPKEIRRTIEHAEASFSRARMLRMIHRLQDQYEAKLARTIFNERLTTYQLAVNRHVDAQVIGLLKMRLDEAEKSLSEAVRKGDA